MRCALVFGDLELQFASEWLHLLITEVVGAVVV
jgi:hypothetical protein